MLIARADLEQTFKVTATLHESDNFLELKKTEILTLHYLNASFCGFRCDYEMAPLTCK